MTTVVDPLGTPSITYNRDGVGIATEDGSVSNPTQLSSLDAGTKVYLINNSTNPGAAQMNVNLPANADVGDVCELVNIGSSSDCGAYPPSGETISGSSGRVAWGPSCIVFRKTAATDWQPTSLR